MISLPIYGPFILAYSLMWRFDYCITFWHLATPLLVFGHSPSMGSYKIKPMGTSRMNLLVVRALFKIEMNNSLEPYPHHTESALFWRLSYGLSRMEVFV